MSLPHVRITIVVLAAAAVTTAGVVRFAVAPDVPAAAVAQAGVDGVTAQVTSAGWTAMDHDMSTDAPGYRMPPAMMPGMPENGDHRLAVGVTVVNTSDDTRPLRPGEEFALRTGPEGRPWATHSHTFGDLPRLAPRNAVNGILFFDLPPDGPAGSPAWLEWTHAGTVNRLAIPLDGTSAPSHHNP